jgi:hypothetical protein
MREIKFRGWSTYDNVWVYGYITVRTTKRDLEKHYYIYSQSGLSGWRVDSKSVGQFTGCYDIGGNEIYEGDILGGICVHGSISDAVVVFKDGRFSVEQNTGEKYTDDVCYYAAYMIIGNTYENQEMVKGG